MRILKIIFISLLVIIVVPLVIAIFLKKEYSVERDIIINKPKAEVFEYVKYLRNQQYYSKWDSMDPNMKKEYRGEDAKVGFVYIWDSKLDSVGAGEQEIKNIIEGEKIEYELRFLRPFESTEQSYLKTEIIGETQTKVTWAFSGKVSYPFNFSLLFMNIEKMIAGDLEIGLSNLKKVLESDEVN
ncbi:MAG: SRPBCC family protein [Bacteroidales bacterium]|nr:SRPBCC family protein [Bacteroidales bacterium]